MLNVYEYFKKMQDEQVILYFKGEITNNLLTSILQLLDDRLERKSENMKVRRKVFSVLLECLQNIYNYQQFQPIPEKENYFQAATLMIRRTNNAYFITTGNYMFRDRVPQLETKIAKVNAMSPDELKEFYREVISEQQHTDTGGAGLGLIDMARKSGEKITHAFDDLSERYCFYTLQVKVLTSAA
jgi:Family of unknown function (DUF6272)